MADHTRIHSVQEFLRIPTGAQVYDALMARIEPELVSANLPTLDVKHAGENALQRAARYARYSKAFAAYDLAFRQWMTELSQAVQLFRRRAIRSAEEKSRGHEHHELTSIESQLEASHHPSA